MTKIKAVDAYTYQNMCNFKSYPFQAWMAMGLPVADTHYPCKLLHGLTYRCELPMWFKSKREARLRFVSGYSVRFDTFPDYALYEIVPLVWDCWPDNVPTVSTFFMRHNVRTAIFTSSQTAEVFRKKFPQMNVLTITEGVNNALYSKGKPLLDRTIDILEVGRAWVDFFKTPLPAGVNHIKTGNKARTFNTDEDFRKALANTKVTINVPRCDVDKSTTGNIETLTQRYWECMLSRVVMVGRAPRELTDLIGYNPVVNVTGDDYAPVINDILDHIEDYQSLVDRNFEVAVKMASWDIRVKQIADYLTEKGYKV